MAAAAAHVDDHHHGPPEANRSSRVEPAFLGMLLFIISEIMVFGAFFTAYFFIRVVGGAELGLRGDLGWQLQGFIEDAEGRLRLQSDEEHRFCTGCHDGIGVTVDQTFSFPRKLPGAAGWRPQDLRGVPDAPQVGQQDGEIVTYFRRVGAGDELRANDELLARYFPGGRLDAAGHVRVALRAFGLRLSACQLRPFGASPGLAPGTTNGRGRSRQTWRGYGTTF